MSDSSSTTKGVKPIPEGYGSITAVFGLNDAASAIDYYKKAFGAEVNKLKKGMGDFANKIMHAELRIGNSVVILYDRTSEPPTQSEQPLVSLYYYTTNADKVFERAVEAGGKITQPIQDCFWGDRMGMITDPYGVQWSIATHKEDPTDEEITKRAKEFFEKKPASPPKSAA